MTASLSCCASLLLLFALTGVASAQQGSWLFEPSYYSHAPAQPVTIGPRASGGPYYSRPQGAFVRGGNRHIFGTIVVGGRGFEQVNYWESWVQHGSQY